MNTRVSKEIIIALAILASGMVISVLSLLASPDRALGQSIFTPFGGQITNVSYECCYGHIVTIDDLAGGQSVELMFYPGLSTLYEVYQVFLPGPNTVGDYFPLGICLAIDDECNIDFVDGSIRQVGTSGIF